MSTPNVGTISVIRNKPGKTKSTLNSLLAEGYSRIPGALVILNPYRETDRSYRTGLDPEAAYIDKLPSEEAREAERALVTSLKERAEKMFYGLDIGPHSDFYQKAMVNSDPESTNYCKQTFMKDGDNVFRLDNPTQLIQYAYLRVHPLVAPSGSFVGKPGYSHCKYYVNDYDVEAATEYKVKATKAEAIALLTTLEPNQHKMVYRALGFNITDDISSNDIYNKLFDYIDSTDKVGSKNNAKNFLTFAKMDHESMVIRDTVNQALMYNVLRRGRGGMIYHGETKLGKTEDEAVLYFKDIETREQLLSLQEELKVKKIKTY